MHSYRSHTCGQLRAGDVGQGARLSGWVHRKRDHGQLLFVDLREQAGVLREGALEFPAAETQDRQQANHDKCDPFQRFF